MAYPEDFPIKPSYSQVKVPTILLPPFWSRPPCAWLARQKKFSSPTTSTLKATSPSTRPPFLWRATFLSSFLKIVYFRFPANVPPKNQIYSFLKQNSLSNQIFSFRSQNFLSKSNRFVQFPHFFCDYKKFCFVCRNLRTESKRFCFLFSSKIFGINRNVSL